MSEAEVVDENQLAVIAKQNGLEENKVTVLLSKFSEPYSSALNVINQAQDINVTSEDQVDEIEQASIARKELKKIRCEVENTRKELKEQSLREGRAIDGMANIIKAVIVPVEQALEEHEKFAERAAAKRFAEKCEMRRDKLAEYTDQPDIYSYKTLTDDAFEALLVQLQEARDAKIAAEKKAEADRLAAEKEAAEEQERIRKENEKLKAEAAAREAQLAKERAVEEKRLAAERAEQEKKLAIERAKAEEERKKREAIEAEHKAEADRLAAEKAEADERARQAMLAPDKEKLNKLADAMDAIVLPHVVNREAGKVLDETKDYLVRISKNLRLKAKQL